MPLVRFPLHVAGERADVQVPFIPIQHIRVDSRFPLHIVVLHQLCNVLLQLVRIKLLVLELIVESSPIHSLHLSPILRKRRFHPANDLLKVLPQRSRVLVVLMLRHVLFDFSLRVPVDRRLQILLPDRAAPQVIARQPISRAIRFAENWLRAGGPRPSIHRVAQFLIGVFLARNVDGSEPIQLLAVRPGAEVDHQFVIKNLLLLIVLQVVERQLVDGEVPVHVLTD